MTVADTSKDSYRKLDKVKEMSQCDRIHEALRRSDKALTVNELNKTALADLDIPNGRVSARINKLRDQGRVVESDKREDMFTEREVKTWTDLVSENNTKTSDSVQDSDTTEDSEWVGLDEDVETESEPDLFVEKPDNSKQEEGNLEDNAKKEFGPGDVIYG